MSVWAVLAAGGQGERLGLDRPKAFAPLRGRPLLAESLERLEACGWVEGIVVVAPAGWEEPSILVAEELGCTKVSSCVTGGSSRSESVRNGVAEVPDAAAVILVHDAARPLVPDALVGRLCEALAAGWDGAIPALPVVDTVKRVRDGQVVETLVRSELVVVQTPQAFVASLLRAALEGEIGWASDCSALVEARGGRVCTVEGDPRLLKITTADDLAAVGALL